MWVSAGFSKLTCYLLKFLFYCYVLYFSLFLCVSSSITSTIFRFKREKRWYHSFFLLSQRIFASPNAYILSLHSILRLPPPPPPKKKSCSQINRQVRLSLVFRKSDWCRGMQITLGHNFQQTSLKLTRYCLLIWVDLSDLPLIFLK